MKSGLVSDTSKSAKNLARAMARQVMDEPSEILKQVGKQVFDEEDGTFKENQIQENKNTGEQELKQKLQVQGQRQLEALEREIDDIQKQKLIQGLQSKINNGEVVCLENYPSLTIEERQVLNAQIQAVGERKRLEVNSPQPLVEPSVKPDRKFMGEGLGAKRQQQRVEKPLPPSG